MTAAVADYRPAREAKEKLKRGELGAKTTIELVANPDLLAELGKARKGSDAAARRLRRRDRERDRERAQEARAKKCDLIVANDVSEPNAGFAVDTNHVQLVDANEVVDVPPAPKAEVAHRILDKIVALLGEPVPSGAPTRWPGSKAALKGKRR